ncbi:MAG: tripartite tricarboxylate transporter substrate binding protein BugD, partial [Polaromonas sp.]|nr:tripartite tricarboxylate transporter substrate binding protein BugD [Polaromonas sp.]
MKQQLKSVLVGCLVASSLGLAHAQTYPDRPISLVVPFAAGGPTDVVARMIAIPMGKSLGQTVLVENTVGA